MSDLEANMEIVGHLLAVRTVLNACITNVDTALEAVGVTPTPLKLQEPGGPCPHPVDKRKDYTPNGTTEPRWVCGVCGEKGGTW